MLDNNVKVAIDSAKRNGRTAVFADVVWGHLPKIQLPSSIFSEGLTLDTPALCILAALSVIEKRQAISNRRLGHTPATADIEADGDTLTRLTGIKHRATLAKGIRGLTDAGYIEKLTDRDRKQQFAPAVYRLLNPTTREPLVPKGDALLYGNDVTYFTLPECCFSTKQAGSHARFATLAPEQKRLYVTLAWLAVVGKANNFEVTSRELQRITGMKARAVKNALDGLEINRLVSEQGFNSLFHRLNIHLYDPLSGRLLSERRWVEPDRNERNWYEVTPKGSLRLADLKMTPEQTETLLRQLLTERGMSGVANGQEILLCCPFHPDSNPSCSFNIRKGCYWCFACRATGTTRTLFTELVGGDEKDLYKRIAAIKGFEITLQNPDEDKTVYTYRNTFGKFRKEVVTFRDAKGNKHIRQRVRSTTSPDGYRYKTDGTPMLFNLDRFWQASVIVIVEGEKDATTVTTLNMFGDGGLVIGTTSGGATSWKEKLAKEFSLFKHKVVILPDNDAPGKGYADAVEATLREKGFEPRRLTLEGTGCKDVTEYVEKFSPEDLARFIGLDWIKSIDGQRLKEPEGDSDSNREPLPSYIGQMLSEIDEGITV
jgi:5S rRNA maturation endonuclease (ribonuclease M5)